MSLQVWLPLNGDLTQQGLSGIEVTNSGATVNNEGKLGKCYQFSNNAIYGDFSGINSMEQMSGSCWVYLTSLSGAQYFFHFGGQGSYPCKFSLDYEGSIRSIINGTEYVSGITLTINTWYHLAVTFDGNIVKWYVNGEEKAFKTVTGTFSASNHFAIGSRTNSSAGTTFAYPLNNGRMNDIRIYDHCLSAKEVKELSKGLVLHYKLDDPYIESTTNLNPTVRPATAANATWGGHVAQWTDYDATHDPVPFNEGTKCEIVYGENGSTGGGASRSIATIAAEPSTTYTYSCYIKPEDDFAYVTANLIYKYEYNGSTKLTEAGYFSKSRIEPVGDGWYRCWGTFTSRDTTTAINISFYTYPLKTTTYWVGGWQIEKNDHMTPFVEPGTTRAGTIFDDSGYENNGSPISSPVASSDTTRYSRSTSFDGTDDGILIENLYLSNIINSEITYSFWIKPNGEASARSVYFGSYSGTSWSIEKSTGNLLRLYWNGSPDETTTGVTIADNIWQHICITKKGTSDIKVYINGQQKWSSTAAHNALTFPTTYRIGRDVRSGDGTPYKGLMSDFRIYATALSAEDIAELYHTAASIDKQGNLFCGEVVE